MRIKTMTATFGALQNAKLELGEGFQLICAPNEGGKSTWCAFWRSMLYGIDTRDRDKKGYLADKNRYQPWSGAPMEGEITLEWQGQDITIRRWSRGATPFGAFSAVYTGTKEPVPGLTGESCGAMLTGVGREVFERSAFIGAGGNLAVTAAPELEKRIAALVSSGEEDVSYSQTEARLRDWLNRRRVNRSVGLIPKLEEQLYQVTGQLSAQEEVCARIARLEGERAALAAQREAITAEEELHRRVSRRELNQRYAQAQQELAQAQNQLRALEQELGPLPDRELLKKAQGELQYLKVLDEEIKSGESALKQAEEDYVQAQIAAQDPLFMGLDPQQAADQVQKDLRTHDQYQDTAQAKALGAKLFMGFGVVFALGAAIFALLQRGSLLSYPTYLGGVILALSAIVALVNRSNATAWQERCTKVLSRYGVDSPAALSPLVHSYQQRCQTAQQAAQQAKTVRGTLNDNKARRENAHRDLLHFVRAFAPQASDLFGCSAALSRALGLDHELAMARERAQERQRRCQDLFAQGGRDFDTLELLHTPQRTPQQTQQALDQVCAQLEQVTQQLNQARGQQQAMGDAAALSAQREELEGELERRVLEYDALQQALSALTQANAQLQQRFSPQLNQLAGQYMARLTGERYQCVTLNRELEGEAARVGDVLPHSALALSRGTADQLYLAVRLAVCQLCLPQRPPLVLDDALCAFDDGRLAMALQLLQELAQQQQVLLFTCHSRERTALGGQYPGVQMLPS